MTYPTELTVLAHIEQTLAESYRKEIDQEENLWRSLPFFAATLALQLAALFQVVAHLPSGGVWATMPARALVVLSLACSLGALGVLAASILPAKFRYVSTDTALLEYTLNLIRDEQSTEGADQAGVALPALQESLARQYAAATDNNRHINERTERLRSVAGLLTIFAVISTLVLVAVTIDNYFPSQVAQRPSIEPARQAAEPPASDGPWRPATAPPPSAAHAGGHEGVVHETRGIQNSRATARDR